ncbi:MAG: hypothetical protein PSV17_07300 [Methylotenera sp.]|uniref:hypothetical protein n=1 Tax=Methylotenera sp. TaxID=2051956 RepID=UPI002486FA5C|nr:hypothetical protein [Methylotenera sp.]MDI1309225.1 hypothetical protein [Methylotenera sp.]
MITKTINLKIILKRTLYTILSILLLLITWIAFAIYHDESPDIGRDEFYALNPENIPDSQNIAVALSGLNAPIGADVIEHGQFVIGTYEHSLNNFIAKLTVENTGELSFVGDSNEFDCWSDFPVEKKKGNYISEDRVKFLLLQNKVLLDRYSSLFNMPDWRGMSSHGQIHYSGQTLINLNKLLAEEIKLNIQTGNSEAAYSKWLANHHFISHILKQDTTAIEHAVFLVLDGINLYSLENLLFKSPEIGIKHFEELQVVLKPTNIERYNLAGMLRADYNFFNIEFLKKQNQTTVFHREFIRNRIYRAQVDLLNRAQKPPATFSASRHELNEKYGETTNIFAYNWLDPFNSFLAMRLTSGFAKNLYLIGSMHAKNALINSLNLSVQIKQKKISPAKIQEFLNQAGKQYDCPFTNQPMQFDAQNNILFCDIPESKTRVAEVRL